MLITTCVSESACTAKKILTDDLNLSKWVIQIAHGASYHLFRKFGSKGRTELKPTSVGRPNASGGSAGRSGPVNDGFSIRAHSNVVADDL